MNHPVNVLILEDSEDDAKLTLRALRGGGFVPTHLRVQTAADMKSALAQGKWDAVISDFKMPGFTGLDALGIFRAAGLDIPFILVSGTIGEEIAVDAMKSGASDYVMKENLARLAPALERELKESQTRADIRHVQEQLVVSEDRFRQLAENIRDVFFLREADSNRLLYISPAYEEIYGQSREKVLGNPLLGVDPIHPDDRAAVMRNVERGRSNVQHEIQYRVLHPDGSIRWIESRAFPVLDESGKLTRIATIASDITSRKEKEKKIARLNRVYAMLTRTSALIVRVQDREELFEGVCRIAVEAGTFRMAWVGTVDPVSLEGKVVAWHGGAEGYVENIRLSAREDAQGSERPACRALRQGQPIICNDIATDLTVGALRDDLLNRGHRSVGCFPLSVSERPEAVIALFAGESGFFDDEETRLLWDLAGDISFALNNIEKQKRLDYLAYFDVLTGLANRTLLFERLEQYKRSAISGGHKVALYILDLERFKNINDSLGRAIGDLLLRQVAQWLTLDTGDASLLARVGADQFAVVLPNVKAESDVARIIEKTVSGFHEHPFQLNDGVYRLTVKIGVVVFPNDGTQAEILFKNAEAALKKAKASGDRYLFYTEKMTEAVAGRLALENQLRQAVDKGEFVLFYQPKVSLSSGKLTSAEALIRWNSPLMGLVPPSHFIPILEETGMIHEVGRWALRKAIDKYLGWRASGLAPVRIAVNVSPRQLRSRGFVAEVEQAISVDPNAAAGLELEITESLIMQDIDLSISTLKAIRAMGVTIAIDDFGTGFSSLSYLAKLPVDTLKIDRSFVIDMTAGPEGLSLVSTIISLAHAMKLKVVAEGVETEEQSRLLRLLSCDEMQGYLFSKPVPEEVFETTFLLPPAVRKGTVPATLQP